MVMLKLRLIRQKFFEHKLGLDISACFCYKYSSLYKFTMSIEDGNREADAETPVEGADFDVSAMVDGAYRAVATGVRTAVTNANCSRRGALGGLLGLAAVLAGCSGEPEPPECQEDGKSSKCRLAKARAKAERAREKQREQLAAARKRAGLPERKETPETTGRDSDRTTIAETTRPDPTSPEAGERPENSEPKTAGQAFPERVPPTKLTIRSVDDIKELPPAKTAQIRNALGGLDEQNATLDATRRRNLKKFWSEELKDDTILDDLELPLDSLEMGNPAVRIAPYSFIQSVCTPEEYLCFLLYLTETPEDMAKLIDKRIIKFRSLGSSTRHPITTLSDGRGDCDDVSTIAKWGLVVLGRRKNINYNPRVIGQNLGTPRKPGGHAVCIFEENGKKFSIDQGKPEEFSRIQDASTQFVRPTRRHSLAERYFDVRGNMMRIEIDENLRDRGEGVNYALFDERFDTDTFNPAIFLQNLPFDYTKYREIRLFWEGEYCYGLIKNNKVQYVAESETNLVLYEGRF